MTAAASVCKLRHLVAMHMHLHSHFGIHLKPRNMQLWSKLQQMCVGVSLILTTHMATPVNACSIVLQASLLLAFLICWQKASGWLLPTSSLLWSSCPPLSRCQTWACKQVIGAFTRLDHWLPLLVDSVAAPQASLVTRVNALVLLAAMLFAAGTMPVTLLCLIYCA